MSRAVARGVAPCRRFISGVHRSRSASGFLGLCQVGLRGRRRVGARWRWRKAPPQGSFPRPRKPWKPQVSSDLRSFPAAASPRLGRELGVGGGEGGPRPGPALPNHASPQGTFTSRKIFIAASESQQLIGAFNLNYDYYYHHHYYFARLQSF